MAILKVKSLQIGDGDMKAILPVAVIRTTASTPPNTGSEDGIAYADGDVFFVVDGANSNVLQRVGGVWVSLTSQASALPLVDGQLTYVTAFSYPIATFPMATLEYTIRRGVGHGQKRYSDAVILSAVGVANPQASEEIMEIGADVGVTLQYVVVGANLEVQYISDALGTAIELKYTVKGWA